jgi:hypothetical protein
MNIFKFKRRNVYQHTPRPQSEACAGEIPDYLRREPPTTANVIELRRPRPTRNRITDMRYLLRYMTYGEFMEYCDSTGSDPTRLWAWANEVHLQLTEAA